MSSPESEGEEAITQDEITGEAPVPSSSSHPAVRNAFTELLKKKPETNPTPTHPTSFNIFRDRNSLGAYTANPTSFPPSRVIYHNADFVAIHDLYPKASIHALLLPRSPAHNLRHPFEAFEDTDFLAAVQSETQKLKTLVAKELRRRYAQFSRKERRREKALRGDGGASIGDGQDKEGNEEGEEEVDSAGLPPGRDWEAEIRVGVHALPSMNHLHVHVISRDMHSPRLKQRNHYNSFNTPFLINPADFPLDPDDPRRNPGRAGYLRQDLRCWRCGESFGHGFKALKDHLDKEFEQWKGE